MTILILVIMVIYVTMVYGPIAAFLVELFPTRIRYTSMSLPYHIGNGWFGGMLPLLATAIVATKGNIYAGLWYPIVVAIMSFVIGSLFLSGDEGSRHPAGFLIGFDPRRGLTRALDLGGDMDEEKRHRGMTRRRFAKLAGAGALAAGGPSFLFPERAGGQQKTLKIVQWSHFVPAYDKWFDNVFTKEWGAEARHRT